MNKKFISALLFGAMLFAPASMFVSCSYDDDIAELRDDLNASKTDLSSLVDEKMKNVDAEIAALGAQAEALEAAYEAADEALQEAIANATNDAKGYADVQAAQAQAASIAAAQKMVEDAKAALEAALATVNSTVAEQGKSIAALLAADKELTIAISAAQARAEEAFALASQAKELAAKNAADVENLTKVVEGLKATLTTLSEQVTVLGENVAEALALAKKNEAAIAAQAELLKALEASNAKALETAKGELQAAIGANTKEIEDLKKAVEAAKVAAAEAVAKAEEAAAQALAAAKTELQNTINAKIDEVKTAYQEADEALKNELLVALGEMNAALTERIDENKAKLEKINADLAYQGKKLKSLVFNPNLYYGGIEAIGVYSFNYQPYQTLTAGNLEENQVGKIKDNRQDSYVRFVPNEQISYIMNPSNAVVSEDVANYGFILNRARYYTTRAAERSFDASDILVKDVVAEDGKLTLTINMTDPDLIADIDNDEVDVIALKYTDKGEDGDTAVVSDFAAIKHWEIKDFTINSVTHGCEELHASPEDAVKSYEDNNQSSIYYTVAYNSDIDLKDHIDVHYVPNDSKKSKQWGNWETIAKKNFYFEYELIGYIADDVTKTNESKHANLKGSVLTPQNANGTEANRSAVGRTPLVRIKLIDGNNNNNVVAVAYTIVAITDVSLEPISFAYGSDTAFEVVCDPVDFNVGYMPTWTQFEQEILSHERIGLSKSDFHHLYELDVDANGNAIQFVEAGKEATVAVPFGKVTEVYATPGYETSVLQWTATNNEAYTWFKLNDEGQRNTSKSVIVRYVPINDKAVNHRPKIYLTLTWTPKDIKTEPVAGITDNDKVANVWYAADANAEGFSDLHAHVNQEVGAPNFNFGVDNGTFRLGANSAKVLDVVKASLKANGYAKDDALANAAAVEFKFATVEEDGVIYPAYNRTAASAKGGKAYTLTVKDNDTEVWAHNDDTQETIIAEIVPTTGKILYKGNKVAKDILNYAESFDLAKGKTLTLQVELVAKTCDPAKSITLNNNMVNVKFVRPLNLDNSTTVKITDSQDQKQTVALGKGKNKDNTLEIKFYDWRNYDNEQVYQYSGNKYNIYALYNITSIQPDKARAVRTNYTGEWADVDNKVFEFSYSGIDGSPVKSSDQGSITYEKKTSLTVRNFQAKIPVIVSYHWGNIYTYITVEVSATDGNN